MTWSLIGRKLWEKLWSRFNYYDEEYYKFEIKIVKGNRKRCRK
jgi:hypothetical protein